MAYSPKYHRLLAKRRTLPVWESKAKFMEMLDKSNVVLLVGETGTGKTTQVSSNCH